IAMAVAISGAMWIAISISRSLARAGALAQGVAGGDLTKTVDKVSRDEVGHINDMVLRLRSVVGDSLSAADNVSSGSQEMSAGAEELSSGATEQASAAEEAS